MGIRNRGERERKHNDIVSEFVEKCGKVDRGRRRWEREYAGRTSKRASCMEAGGSNSYMNQDV